MHIYHIKQDGFVIGQAKGKKKAVYNLNKILQWNGVPSKERKWFNQMGIIFCKTSSSEYRIEESPCN